MDLADEVPNGAINRRVSELYEKAAHAKASLSRRRFDRYSDAVDALNKTCEVLGLPAGSDGSRVSAEFAYNASRPEIVAETKRALGLPLTASNKQVMATIGDLWRAAARKPAGSLDYDDLVGNSMPADPIALARKRSDAAVRALVATRGLRLDKRGRVQKTVDRSAGLCKRCGQTAGRLSTNLSLACSQCGR